MVWREIVCFILVVLKLEVEFAASSVRHLAGSGVAEAEACAVRLKFCLVLKTGKRIVSPNIIGFMSFSRCYITECGSCICFMRRSYSLLKLLFVWSLKSIVPNMLSRLRSLNCSSVNFGCTTVLSLVPCFDDNCC